MDVNFTDLMVLDVPPDVEMLEPYIARVFVGGTIELPYEPPFRARFDAEPVEDVTIDIHGTGFTGYLKVIPVPEARLFVEFDGEDPIDTGLTFSSDPGPIA
jgi:hypothetical protein